MRPFLIAALLLLASPVSAQRRPKPTVCTTWTLYRSPQGDELAVCKDGEKPYLMGHSVAVTLQGPNGEERVLVGYRGQP